MHSGLLQHSLRITGCDARHLPEKPSLGRSSHLAHSNQAVRWRLLQPPFPSRDHHRRAIKPLAESELIQSRFLSQCSNPPRPCGQGSSHELAGPSHICLQDNKSLHILRFAHVRTRSANWNCGAGLLIRFVRQFDDQGGTPASAVTAFDHLPLLVSVPASLPSALNKSMSTVRLNLRIRA